MKGKIRYLFIFSFFILFISTLFLSRCRSSNNNIKPDVRGDAYAQPQTCIQCHKEVYNSYHQTGHFHTSGLISGNHLSAGIKTDINSVFVFNDSVKIAVEKRKNDLYQVAYFKGKEIRAQKFDVAFGSGEKAQTYGYWKGNELFQLPLSRFNIINNWANSPGFPANLVYYDRAIVSHCFECHGSYLDKQFVQTGSLSVTEEYNKKSIIYGIDCQRCHGPAAKHVNYHLDNPADKKAKYITGYQSLTRQMKVNMCAVCHGGSDLKTLRSTFKYQPGDTLANYYYPDFGLINNKPDVHGNQAKLLEMSKCYMNSSTLSCTSCHNAHVKENDNMALYSQKCMDCHKPQTAGFCKMAPQMGSAIYTRCIDCHMPAMPSKLISYKMSEQQHTSDYFLHTHRIAIYPEQTKKILSFIKSAKK
jgi:hypothetical protein